MYQILVDRFANGDETNNVIDKEYFYISDYVYHVNDWDAYPREFDVGQFYGGDLEGVRRAVLAAVQHAQGYAPLKLRSALVPVVTFANNTVQWVLLAGVILINIFPTLLWIGIALFAMTTFFSIVTLPVEINASQRAVRWLEGAGIVDATTRPMAVDALKWAAYTYIIAAIGSLATLFYYISLGSRK